jgi:aflatoxin B1 aldehyde reductase
MPSRPLAAGFLTGSYTIDPQSEPPSQTRFSNTNPLGKFFQNLYGDSQLHEAMAELKSILAPLGISSRDAALRWICCHSALEGVVARKEDAKVIEELEEKRGEDGDGDAIILGASRLEQISENVGSIVEGKLPKQVVESIEKIWMVLKESRGEIL